MAIGITAQVLWLSLAFAAAGLLLALPSALAQTPPTLQTGPPPERTHAGLLAARSASTTPLEVQLTAGFPQIVAGRFTVDGATSGARARAFVSRFASLYGQSFDRNLRISLRRATGDVAVLGQTYKGVPVHGARLSVASAGRTVFGSAGRLATDLRLDPSPRLTAAAAENRLRTALGRSNQRLLGEPSLVIFVPDLVGLPAGPARPAYRLVLAGAPPIRALVDGNTGEVLLQEPLEQTAYNMSLFDAKKEQDDDECYVDTAGVTLAATQSETKVAYANDSDVTTARTALGNAYSLFNQLGRKSYDGRDTPLLGFVHADLGALEPNARWRGDCLDMAASDGVVSNDVWVHELAHGVTQFTSALVYLNQSGALNESFSDAMAAAADNDWLIEAGSFGVLRDMSNPPARGHPGHWLDYRNLPKDDDAGGVHTNSGIPNKARHLMAVGGTYPGAPRKTFPVQGFGRAKMAQIAYLGNQGLDANGDFEDAAGMELTLSSLRSLLSPSAGITAADVCTVRNAWAAVGVAVAMGDTDCDGKSDGSDVDIDGDGIANSYDNCPETNSKSLLDTDGDGLGDVCDPDDDNDGVADPGDNCGKPNPNQADVNNNGKGDVCEDSDLDGALDGKDNCLIDHNPGQTDTDGDGKGDACEADADGDGVIDDVDKCQFLRGGSADKDGDGLGDACDPCPLGVDVLITYIWGPAGGKPKPILKDTDGDGLPDGCEKFTLQAVISTAAEQRRGVVAIVSGGRRDLIVRGRKGARFTTVVQPCGGKPCPRLFDKGALFQVVIAGLRPGVGVRLVDDLGNNVAAARAFRGGGLVLRFRPQADRRYLLDGLVQTRLPRRGDSFSVKVSPVG